MEGCHSWKSLKRHCRPLEKISIRTTSFISQFRTCRQIIVSRRMATRRFGRIATANTAVFICDMQEKFSKGIKYFPEIVENTKRVLNAAKILNLPVVYTEQYPKGLGRTVSQLDITSFSNAKFEKTEFSMFIPEIQQHLTSQLPNINSVILCGIETHACIRHTAIDMISAGFDIHVVVDACSSRNMVDRKYAFKAIRDIGGHLITTESAILGLAPNSAHPKFKELQKLVIQLSADTGI